MRIVKFIAIFGCFLLFLICGSLAHIAVTLVMPSKRWIVLSYITNILISAITKIAGIRMKVTGDLARIKRGGHYIICRHVGYIDGLIIGGLIPGSFVSKKEIKSWPVIGLVIELSGTIFIDRTRKDKLKDSLAVIKSRLNKSINVFLFPEGTSSDGKQLLPFQTAFFRVPITAGVDVVPLTIKYEKIDGKVVDSSTSDDLFWYGDMSFFDHFWKLLGFHYIDVTVTVHDSVDTSVYSEDPIGRKKLSQKCREIIARASGIEDKSINKIDAELLLAEQAKL